MHKCSLNTIWQLELCNTWQCALYGKPYNTQAISSRFLVTVALKFPLFRYNVETAPPQEASEGICSEFLQLMHMIVWYDYVQEYMVQC